MNSTNNVLHLNYPQSNNPFDNDKKSFIVDKNIKEEESKIIKPTPLKYNHVDISPQQPRSSELIIHNPSSFSLLCPNVVTEEIIICSTCNKRRAYKTKFKQFKTCKRCCNMKKARYRKKKRELSNDAAY